MNEEAGQNKETGEREYRHFAASNEYTCMTYTSLTRCCGYANELVYVSLTFLRKTNVQNPSAVNNLPDLYALQCAFVPIPIHPSIHQVIYQVTLWL